MFMFAPCLAAWIETCAAVAGNDIIAPNLAAVPGKET
jgi:hypothetical protein